MHRALALFVSLALTACGSLAPITPPTQISASLSPFESNANAHGAFPNDAFGFHFGSTPEAAGLACIEAGGSWSESGPRSDRRGYCDAPVDDLDQRAAIGAWYCGEPRAVCGVTLATAASEDSAISRIVEHLVNALWDRYGDPTAIVPLTNACPDAIPGRSGWAGVIHGDCEVEMVWSMPGGAIRLHVSNDAASTAAVVDVSYFANGAVEALGSD
jgi:hypothetical protein